MGRDRKRARQWAKELVDKMTLEEKASQLSYNAPEIKRLGIPEYNWWNEALHGVARAGVATSFPQAIALGATFDTELIHEVGEVISTEGRAKYNGYSAESDRDIYKGLTFWTPNVNIFRDPRWGRGQETFGEDPFLTSELGKNMVEGIQGDGSILKAAACAKHFAVHSGPEALRHEFDAKATPKDMAETYLPAFEALVKESKVESVMGAYNSTNGEPCCGSTTLIRDLLRETWKFEGHFVSDCWAIRDFHMHHKVTATPQESAAKAINAGCDLNCGNTYLYMLDAYKQGLVSEETITEAAVRLFTTRYLLGLFDENEYDKIGYDKIECKEHLEIAEKATLESVVLLKNNGILPLDKTKIKTIGIIGPNANSRASLIGNYHGTSSKYITVLEGIQEYVGDEVRVYYSEGSQLKKDKTQDLARENDRIAEAKNVAKNVDVVILCMGLDETLEGEEGDEGNAYASGDKPDLNLPVCQQKLQEAVAQCGKPIIYCLMSGSDINLTFAKENCSAVLQLWYPGARGGRAIAKLLFGEVSPSGKLNVTFHGNLEKYPSFTDYSMKGRTYRYLEKQVQFPFGFGLTYSKVLVENVCFEKQDTGAKVTAQVHNTGKYETDEVVQIYLKNETSIWATPNPALCAFKRIHMKSGEKKEIQLYIPERAFRVVNEKGDYVVDGNCFYLSVGCSQSDELSEELSGVETQKLHIEL